MHCSDRTSREPSSSGGGLQNRRGRCNSSTGFYLSDIGIDRHPSVFQTEIESALLSCRPLSRLNPARRRRPRAVEVMAGAGFGALGILFREANTGAGQDFQRSGGRGSIPPSCRMWVANFDNEVPTINWE